MDLTTLSVLPAVLATCLAGVHAFAGRASRLGEVPRSQWLSVAGGAAVAYVFVHLLPEVGEAARTVVETLAVPVTLLERHVYVVALVGFVTFYGLERYAAVASGRKGAGGRRIDAGSERTRFWIHVGSFAVYNALIGYLLVHREAPGALGLVLYATAMGLHMLVNDYGLRGHYGDAYHRVGRWLLAGSVLVGTAVGYLTVVHEAAIALALSFLAGGVVLNVIKEELPAERESRFGAFAAGAGSYAALLLVV
ncbi:hypothetical protein ACFOZ7_01935 [Natribaculum luteum]|uniref:Zinc permease n=1 Tax=Natribaculum luteum TaxID=1586232 RepID=A0ABD5NUX3_9EURY|nr:hypothetical protein [Natribaculum luteum]